MVEQRASTPYVAGSTPVTSAIFLFFNLKNKKMAINSKFLTKDLKFF